MAKKKAVPNRMRAKVKRENKFIDMPKEKLIKICAIVAAVILVIVLFFVLRRAFDGHLPVKDGVVVTEADNYIVYNAESTTSPRYFKLGTAGDVDGFVRGRQDSLADPNTAPFLYTPEDADSPIASAEVVAYKGEYDTSAANMRANMPMYYQGAQVGDMDESDVNGRPARNFGYDYSLPTNPAAASPDQAGAEGADVDQGSVTYTRGHYVLQPAGRGTFIVVNATSDAQDPAQLATPEQLKEAALKIASALTID